MCKKIKKFEAFVALKNASNFEIDKNNVLLNISDALLGNKQIKVDWQSYLVPSSYEGVLIIFSKQYYK